MPSPTAPMPDFDEIQAWIADLARELDSKHPASPSELGDASLPFCLGHVFPSIEIVQALTFADPVRRRSRLHGELGRFGARFFGRWQDRFIGLEGEIAQQDIVANLQAHARHLLPPGPAQLRTRFRVMPVKEWNNEFGNLWMEWETGMIEGLRARYGQFQQQHALNTATPAARALPPVRRM